MNAMSLAVGTISILLASHAWMSSSAQAVEQSIEADLNADEFHNSGEFVPDGQLGPKEKTYILDRLAQSWHEFNAAEELQSSPTESPALMGQTLDEPTADCLDDCCEPPCQNPCPCMYAQIEALFLWRESRLIDQPIAVDAITGETFMTSSDLNSNFAPGVRATFGKRICGGLALEFTYFGLCDSSASAFAASPDPGAFLIFPGNFFGNVFAGMGTVQADYSSALNGFEANLPCCWGCNDDCCEECGCDQIRSRSQEWFAGFRYLNVDEELNIRAQRTVGGAIEEGSYDIDTDNNLYGLQVGGRTRRMRGRYGWETLGKLGIFANDARQRQSVTDFPDFPLRPTVSSSSTNVAYMGEVGLTGLYQLNPIWNLRAGYSVLWIDGMALAPDQLDFDFASATGGTQLHNGGAILLHGVNVGIEARW